jgi:hypothetical protein
MSEKNLFEGLEPDDLKRLITPILEVDKYRAKLGDDDDICVLSIPIIGNDPAKDLCNFLEKGYEWIIDADVSSGEISNNKFLVFVEMERRQDIPRQILTIIDEMKNLSGQDRKDWCFVYGKDQKKYKMTLEKLTEKIPNSPHQYRNLKDQLDKIKHSAGLNISDQSATKPEGDGVEQLKWLSGLK